MDNGVTAVVSGVVASECGYVFLLSGSLVDLVTLAMIASGGYNARRVLC